MTNNYNQISRNIVRSWYDKARNSKESYNDFDRFISLWVSFNCFFVSEFYNILSKNNKKGDPSERTYLTWICEKSDYLNLYNELVESNPTFRRYLIRFRDLLAEDITHFRGKIADMRPGHLTENNAKEFTDISNFKQFIWIAYQIRCNLFHGNKNPENENDRLIVKGIFDPLLFFLGRVYKYERYIQEK